MWIRNKDGKMININRLDYLTDTDYYNSIIKEKFGVTIKDLKNTKGIVFTNLVMFWRFSRSYF